VAIVWFTDDDRRRMREAVEERRFLDELAMRHARVADTTPLTPEQIRCVDRMRLLRLRPQPRSGPGSADGETD
jgi:hypothetical protein